MNSPNDSLSIRLIWDFRGPDSATMAKHHAEHLDEFGKTKPLSAHSTGHSALTESHSIAWIDVTEDQMIPCRDALRPHRGQRLT